VWRRSGGDPGDDISNLSVTQAATVTDFINTSYEAAWKFYEWPDVVVVEARTAVAQLIAWNQAGKTEVETWFNVCVNDPRLSASPRRIPFSVAPDGIYLSTTYAAAEVYVVYRPHPPVFTSTEFAAAAAYAAGDKIFYPTTGECYTANATTIAGEDPVDTPAKWDKLDCLKMLAEAVKNGAYALLLQSEGQHTTAQLPDSAMLDVLTREADRIQLQSGQYRTISISR